MTNAESKLTAPLPSIHVAYFSNKTMQEWKAAGENKWLGSMNFRSVKEGSILLVVNKDTQELVVVGKTTSPFVQRHLLDVAVYSAGDAKYNRYEASLNAKILSRPMPLSDLGQWCGIAEDDKTRNNIAKCTHMEMVSAFYKGENEIEVLTRLHDLVVNMLP